MYVSSGTDTAGCNQGSCWLAVLQLEVSDDQACHGGAAEL